MPDSLGRLRRVERIGAGGFASVWLYRDDQLDSFVAVKSLADNWAQQLDVRERFLEEARILRRATSDHVVEVYDIGEAEDGTPYFVMTYAEQGTVADLLRDGPIDSETSVDLVEQACRGVADLHAAGILHRDIKPANLLLRTDRQGRHRVLVADLGLAKAMMYASGLTQVVGSPGYMAPEQANRAGGVDGRADVYALGAVAFHLLTGGPPTDPPEGGVTLPKQVDDVVRRAMHRDPAARWPDPMAFAAALREAVAAPDPTPSSRGPKRRAAIGAVVGAAIVAAGVSIAILTGDDGGEPEESGEPTASETSPDAADSAEPVDDGEYCQSYLRAYDAMRMLKLGNGDAAVAQNVRMFEMIHQARLATPPEVEEEWVALDDAFQDFVAVLEETDTTWAEFAREQIDPDDKPEIAAAGTTMELRLEEFGAVGWSVIHGDATTRCDLDPGRLPRQ